MTNAALELAPDDVLTTRAAHGDASAYATLVVRHYPACLRYAECILGDRFDAEDTVQETFMRAQLALNRYDERQQFKAWIFQILVNRCRTVTLQRSRRVRRFQRDEAALLAARAPASTMPGQLDTADAIREAVDKLEPLLREAFMLKYVEDMDYRAMSAILGASVSALKMRVKRACEALRPRLEVIYRAD